MLYDISNEVVIFRPSLCYLAICYPTQMIHLLVLTEDLYRLCNRIITVLSVGLKAIIIIEIIKVIKISLIQ
jgi:hypothetical protein